MPKTPSIGPNGLRSYVGDRTVLYESKESRSSGQPLAQGVLGLDEETGAYFIDRNDTGRYPVNKETAGRNHVIEFPGYCSFPRSRMWFYLSFQSGDKFKPRD